MLIDSPKACAPGYLDVIRAREPERPLSRVNKIHPALKHGPTRRLLSFPAKIGADFENSE
jgi:hypothetical protein